MATICREDTTDMCASEEAFGALTALRLSCNLRVFGSQLGLDASFLDDVESRRDYNERLLFILDKSNNQEQLTWTKLVNTLKQPCLNEHRVASGLCRRLKLDSTLSSSERDSVSSMRSSRSTSLGESLSLEDRGKLLNNLCLV